MQEDTDIQQAIKTLKSGGVILYPTDTIWGIGCDATNENAIDKIYELKNRPKEKSLIVLVSDIEMLKQYVQINTAIKKLIASFKEPTTIIYTAPKGIAKNVLNKDNTIAIRIPNHLFCQDLIQRFGKPIISTSANLSGEKNSIFFEDITEEIKHKADFIVDKKYDTSTQKTPSKLIKIHSDFSIEYLR